jgi:phosphoenolpyruvate synthase/pyruvate phosphate dikinase
MPFDLLLTLPNFSKHLPTEIGERANQSTKLTQEQIPVPPLASLTIAGLKLIADANNLKAKVTKILRDVQLHDPVVKTKARQQIKNLIHRCHIPPLLAKSVHQLYEEYFNHGFIKIYPGRIDISVPPGKWSNIKGEANLIESIVQLWAKTVEVTLFSDTKLPTNASSSLFPSPILIEQQPQATCAGLVFTKDPVSGDKKRITILSTWGNHTPTTPTELLDRLDVDVRTGNVVQRQLCPQKHLLVRTSDGFVSKHLTPAQQAKASLTDQQASELANLAHKVKKKSLNHFQIAWCHDGNSFYLTRIDPLPEGEYVNNMLNQQQKQPLSTITKLYISAGNPSLAVAQCQPEIDGVGVLRGEYTLAKFGIHPLHIIKGNQKSLLKNTLIQTIQTYQKACGQKPVIYRCQNFTSAELAQLQYSASYEPTESNPYLGLRGGLKSLIQPDIFQLEIEAIKEVLLKSPTQLGLMLSFVRSPNECQRLLKVIDAQGLTSSPQFELWLQLNTPENLYNLNAYPIHRFEGFSLNLKSMIGLMSGLNPDDPEVTGHYQETTDLAISLIKKLSQIILNHPANKRPQMFVHLENYEARIVEAAVEHRLQGVTVKPAVAPLAKACIIDSESKPFTKISIVN